LPSQHKEIVRDKELPSIDGLRLLALGVQASFAQSLIQRQAANQPVIARG
jgi:hypothetical protein